jgi:serine/threonine protein kinase
VVSEIQNQDLVDSQYVVKLKKAIKTDSRYYMFMEYCNGGDLKDLMEIKKWNLSSDIIQTIMKQLVQGFNDMISVLVIHRDLKLQNIMVHFPDDVDNLMNMNPEEKFKFM